ncbi:MAG: EAL domain-containing protein, partial [Methylomarinum sp.]|nr:EAL domain-containing protein [Methylomarinum sp.]
AEGVETKDQLTFLQQHECNQVQGYYFSKPVSADKISELLNKEK